MRQRLFSRPIVRVSVALLLLAGSTVQTFAANLKLEAKLIWGTDDAKSPNPEHKEVDAATKEKLRKVFKWKNYYVVNRITKPVPSRASNKFELSKECTIEIKELEGPRVEVKLIGKGKEVHKTTLNIEKGQSVVYSGDDTNQSAWFVIITELADK
ncbi:MAG: hypothetical protein IPK15_01935 [Verrucomicrobia bacterium]|nr:hypothetical protein [Verrucomicrobiota bacterium]